MPSTSSKIGLFTLSVLLSSPLSALGRERWLERDGRAVYLYPRRFGQENPAVIAQLSAACDGAVCGVLAGKAITPLLAAQPECSQQDMADEIIDAAAQFDAATQENMINLAIEYRQAEKNTPPDFTTNPPSLRNSVFCQQAPRNAQLNGLVQAQDPDNDPNLFFDPALGATVTLGSQANTQPFNGGAANNGNTGGAAGSDSGASASDAGSASEPVVTSPPVLIGGDACASTVIVTVSGRAAEATASDAVTVSAGDATATAAAANPTGAAGNVGDFGSCTVPEIEFGAGFDGRTETSFQPADQQSFNHGSAQNIKIITQSICDTLTNSCGADQTAKDTCATATAAADAETVGSGAQADAFNAVFGIQTNFAAEAVIDNQGNVVTPAAGGNTGAATTSAAGDAGSSTSTGAATGNTGATAGSIGDFGSCTVPEIEFGVGFDGRTETSFQPADKQSFNHGSAQAIGIITQSICDTLTNSCGADQTAKDTCAAATDAANAATAKTGAQADAFNAVFGIQTNFANVQPIDDQGRAVGAATGDANANTGNDQAAASASAVVASEAPAASTGNNNAGASTGSGAAAAGNIQTFTGALGGVEAPTVTANGDGSFSVEGNANFNNQQNALVRSCDVQNNQCANAANASGNQSGFDVAACNAQQQQCIANARA